MKNKRFIIYAIITILAAIFVARLSDARTLKILEVDTGVDLSHKELKMHVNKNEWEKLDYIDINSHGTHVAGIILKGTCSEIQLISCKYYIPLNPSDSLENSINCFKRALKENIDIINYSSYGTEPSKDEFDILKQLSDKGVLFITAAGNENKDLSDPRNTAYPAKYDLSNIIVVGNLNDDGIKAQTSNYGLKEMKWEKGMYVLSALPEGKSGYMSGTSQAAAKFTNRLLLKWCKNHD